MNVLQICSVVCSFISLLLLLIALGSNNWMTIPPSTQNPSIQMGLWMACTLGICVSIGMDVSGAYHATRAFMLLGMIAGAVSFFGLCASFFKSQVGPIYLINTSAELSIVAGACAMIAMAIYTGGSAGLDAFYGWSLGLGWASFPLFLITGVLAYISRRGLPEEDKPAEALEPPPPPPQQDLGPS